MIKIQAADAARDVAALWRRAATEVVSVEQDGKPVAIVLSPLEYSKLITQSGPRVKRRVSGVTTDANELFNLPGDMFNHSPR